MTKFNSELLEGLTEIEVDNLEFCLTVLASLASLLSLVTLITNYCNYESRRKASSVFSFFFGISSFLISVTFLLSPLVGFQEIKDNESMCIFQGFFVEYFATCCTLWWFLLTFHLWYTIVRGKLDNTEHVGKYYHLIGWGYPAIVAFALLIGDDYGDAGFWCWINSTNTGLQFGALYAPMAVLWAVGVYMWIMILIKVRFLSKITSFRRYSTVPTEVSFFLKVIRHVIFIFCFGIILVLLSVSRIKIEVESTADTYPYWMVLCTVAPSIGIWHAIIFLFTYENYIFWKYMLLGRCNYDFATVKSVNTSSDERLYPPNSTTES
eukprot:TRINITY_DN10683_c0_g1_i2.p1 TRINITY_DN10683_c0_g1~~TRINITY_DN10683_c0_g1_i2.p1  ORF type:complete len:322 (+),score=48.51 TRINITY_DN10683_c0_g1_i2:70-1035(+)